MLGVDKSYTYNFFGTIFDKGLILVVAFIFTTYIPVSVFGFWSLFLHFIIIGSGIIISPSMNLFSRLYYKDKEYENKLIVKYNSLILFLLLIFLVLYSSFYVQNLNLILLQMACMIAFMMYNYYSLSLRFKNENRSYFIISGKRFFIFCIVGAVVIYINGELNLIWLLLSFLISTLFIIIPVYKQFSFQKIRIKNLFKDEIITLMFYGLATTFLNSIDKFAIDIKSGEFMLGSYSYVVAIATASNVIVEFLKKVHVPKLFRGYSENGTVNYLFPNTLKIQLIGLFALQLILPFIIIWVLDLFRGGQNPYLDFEWLYYVVFVQGLSFAIFSIYHFINPKFIYLKKTNLMIVGILISTVIYILLIFLIENPDILDLTFLRFGLLVVPVLFLWFKSKSIA